MDCHFFYFTVEATWTSGEMKLEKLSLFHLHLHQEDNMANKVRPSFQLQIWLLFL